MDDYLGKQAQFRLWLMEEVRSLKICLPPRPHPHFPWPPHPHNSAPTCPILTRTLLGQLCHCEWGAIYIYTHKMMMMMLLSEMSTWAPKSKNFCQTSLFQNFWQQGDTFVMYQIYYRSADLAFECICGLFLSRQDFHSELGFNLLGRVVIYTYLWTSNYFRLFLWTES